jgi:hypothetical protein
MGRYRKIRPLDTTPDAHRVHEDVLDKLGPARRLEMAIEMSSYVRALAEAGVRQRHPEYDEQDVRRAVLRKLQGRKIYDMCYPGHDIKP